MYKDFVVCNSDNIQFSCSLCYFTVLSHFVVKRQLNLHHVYTKSASATFLLHAYYFNQFSYLHSRITCQSHYNHKNDPKHIYML